MQSSSQSGRVTSRTLQTPRLSTHMLAAGRDDGTPICFIHGNVSSCRFWDEILATLPSGYYAIAPDLRGYGDSEPLPVDATRGLREFADDLHSLFETLGLAALRTRKVHLVGWSMGAGVAMQYAIDYPGRVASLTLESPLSPYGFGGTKSVDGALCWPDAAGSGGGTANPEYVKLLGEKDRGDSQFSPRGVMNAFYFRPPFRAAPEREEELVTEMLKMVIGDGSYPGDMTPSPNWPTVAPGTRGFNNAMSPTYCNLGAFATISPRPPVLWIRGDSDQIVSDTSLLDFGYLGQLGAVPGWPGDEVYPPQPMVSQMRGMLDAYRANGGSYREIVFESCGHSPHIEHPSLYRQSLLTFLEG